MPIMSVGCAGRFAYADSGSLESDAAARRRGVMEQSPERNERARHLVAESAVEILASRFTW